MKTLEIKSSLYQKIEELNSRQLNEVYGLFQNYLNANDDSEEWDNYPTYQKDKILAAIQQADANDTKPIGEILTRLRGKYNINA